MSKTLTKICSKCKTIKSESEFGKRASATDGLKGQCKECINVLERERNKKRRLLNTRTEKICDTCNELLPLTSFQEYKNSHGTLSYQKHCRVCQINGQSNTRDSVLYDGKKLCIDCRKLRPIEDFYRSARGLGGRRSYCIECSKIKAIVRYEKTKPKHKENSYKWREHNKEAYLAQHRIHQFNRRAAKAATDDGTVTNEFCILTYSTEFCTYCLQFTPSDKRTMDHVVPLSKGGAHSASNIVMACFRCNASKKESDLEEWRLRIENTNKI